MGRLVEKYVKEGRLVPDEIVIGVVKERVSQPDRAQGFVLDGYPRTLRQAEALEVFAPIDVALYLWAPKNVVIERICGRRVCPRCGAIYHVKWKPPKREGVCDICGARLIRRIDDRPEVVEKRFKDHLISIKPILQFYGKLKKLLRVDAVEDAKIMIPKVIKLLEEMLVEPLAYSD